LKPAQVTYLIGPENEKEEDSLGIRVYGLVLGVVIPDVLTRLLEYVLLRYLG